MRFPILFLVSLLSVFASAQVPKVSTGRIVRIDSFRSKFVTARNVDVWLPPDYPSAGRYDVLYMHDGQMLFDSTITWNRQEWRADETAGALIAHQTRPFIIVGIHNNARLRLAEYFPEKAAQNLPPSERDSLLKEVGGQLLADEYLAFVTKEVKPYIDSAFATNPAPAHTFIAGSSMGGLISLYAVCEYPRVFGGAACLSTHWPGSFRGLNDGGQLFGAIRAYLERQLPDPRVRKKPATAPRLYMDYGNKTLDSFYTPLQPQIDAIVRKKGYRDEQFSSRFFPGADHSERSWAARLSEPFRFLFRRAR
ncbi:alpha/beta hydrolase [Flaviaesturariibacter aridisoli]|uniref:Alpha/beta hydrolase n=1 Tax=Flaviaesturariibacter aridisoli TaxID=2545761 RepID=A0A4R4E8I7_9BACT|nr:alpha/beta hydrolase-fold protein [Flaviaesturariibacter aridisoli]TCZ74108.1 alpha/beta hydrolase [Flaviaesturariibacter aridisoli]